MSQPDDHTGAAAGRTSRVLVLACAAVVGACCGAVLCLQLSQAHFSPSFDPSQFADEELEPRLRSLRRFDGGATAILVESLASTRDALRLAAWRVVHEMIDEALSQPADERAKALDDVAHRLSAGVARLNGEGLRLAADIASRLIAVTDCGNGSPGRRIRDCHVVLAAIAHARLAQRLPERSQGRPDTSNQMSGASHGVVR
jgi:hypothetical protein